MKRSITLFAAFILCIGFASAQAFAKMGAPVSEMISTKGGILVQAGSVLSLGEGTAPDGFKFIYTSLGGKPTPLGYGANNEVLEVDQIRYVKKQDAYLILSKVSGKYYLVDLDKAIGSGEVKEVVSKAN